MKSEYPSNDEANKSLVDAIAKWPDVHISDIDMTFDITCPLCRQSFQVSHWVLIGKNQELRGHLCQCDKCSAIDYRALDGDELAFNCECGGTLRQDQPLRCPKCSSSKLMLRKHFLHIV